MTETQPIPVNPSPKARFISLKTNIEQHRVLMDKPETQRALDCGLLEYQRQLCEQNADMSGAAANHFKLRGAVEFIHVLKNLSEVPRVTQTRVSDNLNHGI